jgi:hypothetical protein
MTPLPAKQALDQFFLDTRARLLDVAAILDRLDRGADAGSVAADPRMERIAQAIEALKRGGPGRAEQVQRIFSLAYDPAWPKPTPR